MRESCLPGLEKCDRLCSSLGLLLGSKLQIIEEKVAALDEEGRPRIREALEQETRPGRPTELVLAAPTGGDVANLVRGVDDVEVSDPGTVASPGSSHGETEG